MSTNRLFLTLGGLGRLPRPALSSTLVTLPVGAALLLGLGAQALFTLTFALFLVGIFEVNRYESQGGPHDDPAIVLDETVGLWTALSVTVHGLALAPNLPYALPAVLLLSLTSFLLFDQSKPSTIGWIARKLKGGLGVMLDDLLAGFAAGMLNLLIFKLIALAMERIGG